MHFLTLALLSVKNTVGFTFIIVVRIKKKVITIDKTSSNVGNKQ